MRWLTLGAILVASAASAQTAESTRPLSPRNANYSIDARLDTASRTIAGSEVITWRNLTAKPTRELQFHLYWNAWRNTRSTWLREALLGSNRNFDDRRDEDWGRIDITSINLLGSSPGANESAFTDLTSAA